MFDIFMYSCTNNYTPPQFESKMQDSIFSIWLQAEWKAVWIYILFLKQDTCIRRFSMVIVKHPPVLIPERV